jgi:hypothetical protein
MARRRASTVSFDAIAIEGAFITTDMLALIAAIQASEQTEADYDTPPGLKLRDEIGRYYRIGEALWATFERLCEKDHGGLVTVNFVTQLLAKVFGFLTLATSEPLTIAGRIFPVRHAALDGRVPLVVAPKPDGIDKGLPQFGDAHRRRSATLLLQEFLNASDGRLFGLVTDGSTLRVMRDNASMTRPAWIEADLERIFGHGLFADFSALWLLIHQSRFGKVGTPPSDCALERWREKGREQGVTAREQLRDGVKRALKALGEGFLQQRDNAALVRALETGELDARAYFQELLRIVYRFIFLFAAEDRGLLRPKEQAETSEAKLYAEGYSFARLRTKTVRSLARDRHHDLWDGVRIVFRGLARGETRLALPALGGPFASDRTPHLDSARVENRYLLAAVDDLAWMREQGARVRVNWRDMETEELGSVYESLLELTPRASASEKTFTFAGGAETKGSERKSSGSYYTPDSLVQLLLDSTLEPVIEETVATNPGREAEALLQLDIIDPAAGSGHFLLAAARRLAVRIAQLRSPGSPSAEDYRRALRDVSRHCLYGVDRNPMAVELCKVAIWIETVEPGKPLSFLDNRIRLGDSLIGIFDLKMLAGGIPDEAYKPLTGDEKVVASHYRKLNKVQRDGTKSQLRLAFAGAPTELADAFAAVEAMPEEHVDEVTAKAVADAAARGKAGWWQLKTACDLFVSAFFAPKTGQLPDRTRGIRGDTDQRIPTTDAVWRAVQGEVPSHQLLAYAVDLAGEARAFHWPLEFPDVMRKGGFDVVIGNPPWEVSQFDEVEYFAGRSPEIAALAGEARKKAIKKLETEQPRLWRSFLVERRQFEALNDFVRANGRFPLTARGKINTYALFAELFARATRGRAGAIVPTGIATDSSTSAYFSYLIDNHRLISLTSFYEVRQWFSATDDRKSFCIVVIGDNRGKPTFRFDVKRLEDAKDPDKAFQLSADEIALVNPNTKTAPVFRSRADAELTRQIYAYLPVLFDESKGESGNAWSIRFQQGLFNMTSDSGLFRTATQLQAIGATREGTDWCSPANASGCERGRYLPLYEAKMIHHYDHRWATYKAGLESEESARDTTPEEKREPSFEPTPRYWVPANEVEERLVAKKWGYAWLAGWRDIALRSVERTLIASVMPRVGVNHKIPLFMTTESIERAAALIACFSSLVLDFVARQKIGGTSMTYFYVKQFPVPRPDVFTASSLTFIVPRVLELTYTSNAIAPFARDLGCQGPPFAWDEERRAWRRAELDAYYARLYGLTREELLYILDPAFVKGSNYPSETFRVLRNNEEAKYGEYRTARLVMQAWDELAAKEKVA